MDVRSRIAGLLDRTADRLVHLVQDLPEEDVRARPSGLTPIAWQVGHVSTVDAKALARAGLPPPIPEDYPSLFDSGTGREGDYPPLADLLSVFAGCQAATRSLALEGDLDRVINGVRSYGSPGEALLFLTYHRGYHIGKITSLRALLGKRLS